MPVEDEPIAEPAEEPQSLAGELNQQTDTPEQSDETQPLTEVMDDVEPEVADDQPQQTNGWAAPARLLGMLDKLPQTEAGRAWANDSARLVRQLFERNREPAEVKQLLTEVRRLAEQPIPQSAAQNSELHRAHHALLRRVDIWDRLPGFGSDSKQLLVTKHGGGEKMDAALAEVDKLTRGKPQGESWRQYLQLDWLKQLAAAKDVNADSQRRAAARAILARLAATETSSEQRSFISAGPVSNLRTELERWASEAFEARQLLADIEQFETTGLSSDGSVVAKLCHWLQASDDEADRELGDRIDERYRNANFRVAVASYLLNRLLPGTTTTQSPVNETIIGNPVCGQQSTSTRVTLRLLPDEKCVRMGLEGRGTVSSNTSSTARSVTFHTAGDSTFLVRKLIVLDPKGLRVWPAVCEATNNWNDLLSMETGADGIPIFGPLVRNIALGQYEDSQPEVRMETEPKIAHKARVEFDAQVQPKLTKAVHDFHRDVLVPLDELGIQPVPRELATTAERVMIRVCLANEDQLGSNSPRPRAPGDALLSMQWHQSALNNAAQGLELEGQTFTLPEMFEWIGNKLHRELTPPDDAPENLVVTFAPKNALQFTCTDGRIELKISIAKLENGNKKWRNFTARTYYLPDAQGLDARFVRDSSSTIFLEGEDFKGRAEIMLRTILSKVLSKNRPLSLMSERFSKDPRVKDLAVKQFVIQDGWIGLAYGLPAKDKTTQRGTKPGAELR